jgi:LAO/AO transport system kinase
LRAIARAATAIENRDPDAAEILKTLFPHTGNATTFGITGPPGAGKSTLVDQMVRALRREGRRVGILAVDPTSPFTGGAILGDRIRMQSHHADPDVFIRSMATRGQLGGLAPATADLSLLLDAAGYETILIETVGVGQDEVDIVRLADVTAVVLMPGMGDDIQAIKAGMMEIGDVYLLNKADQPGIDNLEHELKSLLSLAARQDGWSPPIVRCVAAEGTGVDAAIQAMRSFHASRLGRRRLVQNWSIRLRAMYRERVSVRLNADEVERAAERVAARETDPFTIVNDWLERY